MGSIIRSGDYKLIKLHTTGDFELYNLADDPGEQNNLAVTRPDITSRLLCELETWFESVEADRNSIDDPLHRPSVMQ